MDQSRNRGVVEALKPFIPALLRSATRRALDEASFRLWRFLQPEAPILRQPIFMIGCPRSGTSISVELFARHPWVVNWSEAMEIWDPKGYKDPDADHHWGASDVADEDVRRLHERFEWYRQKRQKQRFINKHPRSSVRIDYINTVFPDAYFIHVIRDGRAVVSSILSKIQRERERQAIPFGDFCKPPRWREYLMLDSVERAATQWRDIVSYILARRESLADRYLEFRYEDMCQDPRGILHDVYRFVGLPNHDVDLDAVPVRLTNMNQKSASLLSTEERGRINRIQGDLLVELGYDI